MAVAAVGRGAGAAHIRLRAVRMAVREAVVPAKIMQLVQGAVHRDAPASVYPALSDILP